MKEQHPIDDLFSRALRDAEAEPSGAVWEGIARERNRSHLILLGLRRRWGWLAVLIFLGGAGGYAIHSAGRPTATITPPLLEGPYALHKLGEASPGTSGMPVHGPGRTSADQTVADMQPMNKATNRADGAFPVALQGGRLAKRGIGIGIAEQESPLRVQPAGRATKAAGSRSTKDRPRGNHPLAAEELHVAADISLSNAEVVDASMTQAAIAPVPSAHHSVQLTAVSNAGAYLLPRLPARTSLAERELLGLELQIGPVPASIGLLRGWWVAATAGQFRESRSWKGSDGSLARALQGTEVPHPVTSIGFLVGSEHRNGWGFAVGVEHAAVRYDFRHLDRFRSRRDSIISYLVTLNTEVVGSYTDTLTTFIEVRKPVATVNRYAALRIPVEVSWHTAYRRFHLGVRGGLALEFNTTLSGITLTRSDDGARSVNAGTIKKSSATFITGSLAADLGYALTERWSLWASPTYAAGLFPLPTTGNSPYAVPDRLGIRFRLAYALRTVQ